MRCQRDLLDMFSYKGLAGFAFLMPSCSSHVASEVEAELLVGEAETHYALTCANMRPSQPVARMSPGKRPVMVAGLIPRNGNGPQGSGPEPRWDTASEPVFGSLGDPNLKSPQWTYAFETPIR